MTLHRERVSAGGWVIAALAVIGLAAPSAAQAQDATSTQTLEVTQPAPEQIQTAPTTQQSIGQPYWASIGGFAMDSDDAGYGFFGPQYIRPFRPKVAFIGSANANYLFYEFDTPSGRTNVRSPGMNVMGGLMFGNRNWLALQAGPSFKRRSMETVDPAGNVMRTNRDVHVGFNLGTSAWYDPTTHNNLFAMYNYETVDSYHWGRLAFKEQMANRAWQGNWTPFLGLSYTGQGNENIRSHQVGPFIELAHGPSRMSVLVGGGYKFSEFEFEPDKKGTWFTIGFYHRLR